MSLLDSQTRKQHIFDYINLLHQRRKRPSSGIIYCRAKATCDDVSDFLRRNGLNAQPYHSGIRYSRIRCLFCVPCAQVTLILVRESLSRRSKSGLLAEMAAKGPLMWSVMKPFWFVSLLWCEYLRSLLLLLSVSELTRATSGIDTWCIYSWTWVSKDS